MYKKEHKKMITCILTIFIVPVAVSVVGATSQACMGAFFGVFSAWKTILGIPNIFIGIFDKFSGWFVPFCEAFNKTVFGS